MKDIRDFFEVSARIKKGAQIRITTNGITFTNGEFSCGTLLNNTRFIKTPTTTYRMTSTNSLYIITKETATTTVIIWKAKL